MPCRRCKGLLRAEKAGHTGTLDPLATGLLPLCFGAATKFSQLKPGRRQALRRDAAAGRAHDDRGPRGRGARDPGRGFRQRPLAGGVATLAGGDRPGAPHALGAQARRQGPVRATRAPASSGTGAAPRDHSCTRHAVDWQADTMQLIDVAAARAPTSAPWPRTWASAGLWRPPERAAPHPKRPLVPGAAVTLEQLEGMTDAERLMQLLRRPTCCWPIGR
jgi:hypothetical protein